MPNSPSAVMSNALTHERLGFLGAGLCRLYVTRNRLHPNLLGQLRGGRDARDLMVAIFKAPCDEQFILHKVPTRPVSCPKDVARPVLIATILASSMVFIDSSAVNVALPTLQRQLGASA